MRIITESDHIAFNMLREARVTKEYKRDEMRKLLKTDLNYPGSDQFLMAITGGVNPPVIKVRRGIYMFNPKPVYKDRLQTVFSEYAKTIKSETARNSKKISIEEAILVLKNAGYKVLKPVTQFEEI